MLPYVRLLRGCRTVFPIEQGKTAVRQQFQANLRCHRNSGGAVHNCSFMKESTEVESETRWALIALAGISPFYSSRPPLYISSIAGAWRGWGRYGRAPTTGLIQASQNQHSSTLHCHHGVPIGLACSYCHLRSASPVPPRPCPDLDPLTCPRTPSFVAERGFLNTLIDAGAKFGNCGGVTTVAGHERC